MKILRGTAYLILIFLSASLRSNAEVSISFTTGNNVLTNSSGGLVQSAALFFIYWSSTADTSGFNPADPLNPTGGDIILTNATSGTSGAFDTRGGLQSAGRITGHGSEVFGAGSGIYSPGYIYIALFDTPYVSFSGSITNGTYYGLGPVSSSLTQDFGAAPPPAPDDYGVLINASSIVTDHQVIPEPCTAGLAFLGIGVMALSRRFRGEKKRRMS